MSKEICSCGAVMERVAPCTYICHDCDNHRTVSDES